MIRPNFPNVMDRIAPDRASIPTRGAGLSGMPLPGPMTSMPSPTRPSNVGPIMPKPGMFGRARQRFADPTFLKSLGSRLSGLERPAAPQMGIPPPFQMSDRFGGGMRRPMMRRAQMDLAGGY